MERFRGLNEHQSVTVYQRHLPHWRQDGCSYFVTFHLADSIPAKVIKQWQCERNVWLKAWGLDGIEDAKAFHAKYMLVPEPVRRKYERSQIAKPLRELDRCHGSCIFRNGAYAECAASALRFFDEDKLQCGDFVVMPNHVHWIVMPLAGHGLGGIMQSVKRYISRELGKVSEQFAGRIWQPESYDRCIRNRDELSRIRRYIEQNPAKAKLGPKAFRYYRAGWLDEL